MEASIGSDNQKHTQARKPQRLFESAAQPSLMKVDDPAEEAADRGFFCCQQFSEIFFFVFFGGRCLALAVVLTYEVTAKRRRPTQRKCQGSEKRNPHGQRECPEECARDPGNRN